MNKVKIGDRVQLKAKAHTWHTRTIIDMYKRRGSDEYGETVVFDKSDFEEIACLLGSKARRTKLKGIAVNYGSDDDEFQNTRKVVRIEFNWKGLKVDFYCSEKDLKRL